MNTNKSLIGLTLLFVLLINMGAIFIPNTFAMSFADVSITYLVIRMAIAVLLVGLLVTRPPREMWLRTLIGVVSVILVYVSAHDLLTYRIHLLDAVIFMEVAIIFAVEALESHTKHIPVNKRYSRPKKIPVYIT